MAPFHALAPAPDGVDGNQHFARTHHRKWNGLLTALPLPLFPAHAVLLPGLRGALLGTALLVLITAGRRVGDVVVRVVAVVVTVLGDRVLLCRVVAPVLGGVRG